MTGSSTPYELDPKFERIVVFYACNNRKFYTAIGKAVDPDAMDSEAGALAVRAAHAIRQETGNPPRSATIVIQRIRSWHVEGRATMAELRDVYDLFESVENDSCVPDWEDVRDELVPLIRARHRREAAREGMRAMQAGSDLQGAIRKMEKAERLGIYDDSLGLKFAVSDYSEIDALRFGDRAPFRIYDLDKVLSGGPARGTAMLVSAKSGGGKTTCMSHWACEQWLAGLSVCYASFELSKGLIEAKFRAKASGMPCAEFMSGNSANARAVVDRRILTDHPDRGHLYIQRFRSSIHKWEDVIEWQHECAEDCGHLPQVLIVDPIHKVAKPHEKMPMYEAQGFVMDAMHDYAEESNIWVGTTSQPQRGAKDRKIIQGDDLGESQKKIEGCDLFMSMNKRGDKLNEIYYWVGKHRAGESEVGAGPIPHDFAYGRLVDPKYSSPRTSDESAQLAAWDDIPGL